MDDIIDLDIAYLQIFGTHPTLRPLSAADDTLPGCPTPPSSN